MENLNYPLIALFGHHRAGKDTFYKIYSWYHYGASEKEIKQALEYNLEPPKKVYNYKFSSLCKVMANAMLFEFRRHYPLIPDIEKIPHDHKLANLNFTRKEFLIALSEFLREQDPEIYIKHLLEKIRDHERVIITDLRYTSEYEWLKENIPEEKMVFVKITRGNEDEKEYDYVNFEPTITIDNDGDLDKYIEDVIAVYSIVELIDKFGITPEITQK